MPSPRALLAVLLSLVALATTATPAEAYHLEASLAYREAKHTFYHHHSERPPAERQDLAIKWHYLADAAWTELERREGHRWGGSRTVANEIIRIVAGRHRVTSRKRTETYGNPGSDHHTTQRDADAVDFATADNHKLKNEISRKLGGPKVLPDYGSFHVKRNGRVYRVQMIAGTHGTGPHLHAGVRRLR